MDSQSAETSDGNLCLAALVHFLDRIDQDTREWYYAINGDHNHPYSLCSTLGLSFDDTMVILETCGLAKRTKNKLSEWAVEPKAWKKLIRFEVVQYSFQGNKGIDGNLIKCKKLYCIRVGALNGRSADFIPKNVYGKNAGVAPRIRSIRFYRESFMRSIQRTLALERIKHAKMLRMGAKKSDGSKGTISSVDGSSSDDDSVSDDKENEEENMEDMEFVTENTASIITPEMKNKKSLLGNLLREVQDQQVLEEVLAEIVYLLEQNNMPISYKSRNSVKKLLVAIPTPKDSKNFFRNTKWLSSILNRLESKRVDELEGSAAQDLVVYLAKKHKQDFIAGARITGYPLVQKMSPLATAAMWADASVNLSNVRKIIKHIEYNTGGRLSVPEAEVRQLGNGFLEPTYNTTTDANGKTVDYWTQDICDCIKLEIKRVATKGFFDHMDQTTQLNFGYPRSNLDDEKGIDFVMGGDHASDIKNGVFRHVGKLNLSSPEERRTQKKSDMRFVRVIKLAHISCITDTKEILRTALSAQINDAALSLQQSSLLAAKDSTGSVQCFFIPRMAMNIIIFCESVLRQM